MHRRTVAIIAIVFCVAVATTLGLFFGLKKPATIQSAQSAEPVDLARVCSDRALSRTSCEQLKFEWDASKRNAVSSCDAENADADARLACVAKRMTRLGSAADLFATSGGAVYPENYPALRMRVDSQFVCESDGALVVGGTSPVLVRFAKRGSEWTIETPDASRVVVVSESGALALRPRAGSVAARFVAGGTLYPSSITLSPVSRNGSALRSAAGSSVEVRLVRAVSGLLVEVKLTADELSTFEYASNVSAIDAINGSGCCVEIGGKCAGAAAAAQMQRFPLCCGCVDSDPRWCAWKASADAAVVDEGELARLCCSTRARMFDVGPDYTECAKGANLPGQYSKCDPSEEHTFTFVPAGAWALAPNGVRIPAFGRVAFMRTVGAGYRGVRCTTE